MELFEQIRREYKFGVRTIAGVARRLGAHRRMMREALRSAEATAPRPEPVQPVEPPHLEHFLEMPPEGDPEVGEVKRKRSRWRVDAHDEPAGGEIVRATRWFVLQSIGACSGGVCAHLHIAAVGCFSGTALSIQCHAF